VTSAVHHALLLCAAAAVLLAVRRSIGLAVALTFAALIAANGSFPQVKSAFLEARWGAVLALSLVLLLSLRRLDARSAQAFLPLLALPALGLLSVLWSVDPRLTVERVVSFGLMLVIAGGLAVRIVRDPNDLSDVTDWLSVLAGVVLLASLLAVATPNGVMNSELRGVFENANGLGLFLGLTYPFVAASFERRNHTRAVLVVLLVFGVIDVLSASRSGIVALLVSSVVYEIACGRRGRVLVGGVIVAVLVAAALVVEPAVRSNRSAEPSASSPVVSTSAPDTIGGAPRTKQTFASRITGARSEAWSATLGLARDKPLAGFGFGTGDRIFARYPERVHFLYFEGASPNDGYLQMLLELGLLGLVALAIPLGAASRRAVTIAREGADVALAAVAAVFVAALGVAVVESVFEAAGAPWAPLIWISAALLLVSDRLRVAVAVPAAQTWRPSPRAVRISVAVAVAGAIAIAAGLVLARWAERKPVTAPRVAAATIAREQCAAGKCQVAEVTQIQGTVWWVRLTGGSGCFVVQLKGFSDTPRKSSVKPATCRALPLASAHALTVGVVESGPPYFSPPVEDPGGYEPLVVQALARQLGIGLVRWSKASVGSPRTGVDFALHEVFEGNPVPADDVPYLNLDEEVIALRGSPASSIKTVAAARAARLGAGDEISARYADRFLRPITPVTRYDSLSAALGALRARKVQALIVDRANGAGVARAASDLVQAGVLPTRRYYVMRFPSGSRLEPLVAERIDALRRSGELERLRALALGDLAPLSYLR